jgi:hypothetical protein
MRLLLVLLLPLLASEVLEDNETLKQQIMAVQPFSVKAPRWWKPNPDSMKRLILRGERSDAPVPPVIMIELMEEKSDDYLREMTQPKRRADHEIPVYSFDTRRGKARAFKKTSTERFPRGAPDAVTVESVQEYVVVDIDKRSVLFVLVVPQADYKPARREFMKIIDSLRIREPRPE